MAREEDFTSDSLDTTETDVPPFLLDFIKSQVIDYLTKAKDFSAKIRHSEGQPAKLVLSFNTKAGQQKQASSGTPKNLKTNTILVKNLPALADEELLEIFFESEKKQGGGPVKNVNIFSDKTAALVEFCEESSVETVLKKMPLKFGKTELDIMPYRGLLAGKIAIDHVDIRGLNVPQEFTHDLLEIHLGYIGQVLTSGPATMLKVGSRVVRGKDWKWGNQDNNGPGTVVEVPMNKATEWFIVKWDGGCAGSYRMGRDGCYDLMLSE